MKRKFIFLLFIIGIIGSFIGIIKFINNRSPRQGVLKVNSSPNTSIFLENRQIGKTPYEDKISEGEYNIKLVPESTIINTVSWQGRILIKQNLLTYVNADLSGSDFLSAIDILWLERISGNKSEIAITTDPEGTGVSLDGENKGTAPLVISDVKPGDHTILVSSPGFISRQMKIKTHEGYKLVASLKLALSSDTTTNSYESTDSAQLQVTPSATTSAGLKIKPSITPSLTATPSATNVQIPQKPYVIISDTPTGFLRVRMGPATTATEAGKVKPNEKYSIIKYQNGWYEIQLDSETTGWVSGLYVEKVE